jgi:hypothetical protein
MWDAKTKLQNSGVCGLEEASFVFQFPRLALDPKVIKT